MSLRWEQIFKGRFSHVAAHLLPGEPDNWNGLEKCVKILSQYHDGTWSDQSCDALYTKAYFVCNMTDTGPSPDTTTVVHETRVPRTTAATRQTTVQPMSGQISFEPQNEIMWLMTRALNEDIYQPVDSRSRIRASVARCLDNQ